MIKWGHLMMYAVMQYINDYKNYMEGAVERYIWWSWGGGGGGAHTL